MKTTRTGARILALAICMIMLLGIAAPALAATIYGYSAVAATTAAVYKDTKKSSIIGSFKKGDIVAVLGATTDGQLYQIMQASGSAEVGYIAIADVGKPTSVIPSGKKLATMQGASSSTGTPAAPGATASGKGQVANVKKNVNWRATADTKGKKLGSLKLGAEFTILGEENGFYKIMVGSKTGYIAKEYVKLLAPPVSDGYLAAAAKLYTAADTTATGSNLAKNTIATVKGESGNFYYVTVGTKTGYILKAAFTPMPADTASSGSGTVTAAAKMIRYPFAAGASVTSLKKGAAVTILATNGIYTKVTSGNYTGYVETKLVKVTDDSASGSGSTVTTGGKDTGKITVANAKVMFNVEPGKGKASSTVASGLAAGQKTNSATYGYIYIKGTNISRPILHNRSDIHYYATRNISKKSDSAGSIYTFWGGLTRNNVVTGHNMRTSGTMFHELHHIYGKTMGLSACQTTDAKCKNSNWSTAPDLKVAANRIWEISFGGYNQWEVFAMYKTEANEPASTLRNNYQSLATATPAQISTWIQTQKNNSHIKFNTPVSTNDVFMTIYTCGTNYDHATAQSRLYFILKAVK